MEANFLFMYLEAYFMVNLFLSVQTFQALPSQSPHKVTDETVLGELGQGDISQSLCAGRRFWVAGISCSGLLKPPEVFFFPASLSGMSNSGQPFGHILLFLISKSFSSHPVFLCFTRFCDLYLRWRILEQFLGFCSERVRDKVSLALKACGFLRHVF